MRLSTVDRKILNSLQEDMPLEPRPFKILAERIGVKEPYLLNRIESLKKRGLIRHVSASLDHRRLGFKSTLVAMKVPEDKLERLVKEIIAYPEITHCYLREGKHNLWVVFIYKNKKLNAFLNRVIRHIGKRSILNIRTSKQFKLKTNVKI